MVGTDIASAWEHDRVMTSTLDSFPPPDAPPESPAPPRWPTPPGNQTGANPLERKRSAGHIIAIVAGALALLPGLGMLTGGTAVAIAQATATDDGYFRFTPDRLESDGVAVITDDIWLDDADDAGPWVLDWLDLDVRLRAEGARSTDDVFIGIAHNDDVEDYLAGARYSIVDELDGHDVSYRQESGVATVVDPADVDIWEASASGPGEQELTWTARSGRWSIVVMNADGSPGLAADVELGAKSDVVTPIAIVLIVFGGLTLLTGIGLIVVGVRGRRPTIA